MKKKVLLMTLILALMVPAASAFATIKDAGTVGDVVSYTVRDEYGVEISKGTSGTFPLKTPSGATKFVMPAAQQSMGTMNDAVFYITVASDVEFTFSDGFTKKFEGAYGTIELSADLFKAHPSKSISAKVVSTGKHNVIMNLKSFGVLKKKVEAKTNQRPQTQRLPNQRPQTQRLPNQRPQTQRLPNQRPQTHPSQATRTMAVETIEEPGVIRTMAMAAAGEIPAAAIRGADRVEAIRFAPIAAKQ